MTRLKKAYGKIAKCQRNIPVDVVKLAEDLGAKVWKVNTWPGEMSGMIKKDPKHGGRKDYAIFVNAHHPIERRRFTIAHEIAHLILHKKKIGDGFVEEALYDSGLDSLQEQQANNLAAEILMPWPAVVERIENGVTDVGKLADIFRVTKSMMAIRLKAPLPIVTVRGENPAKKGLPNHLDEVHEQNAEPREAAEATSELGRFLEFITGILKPRQGWPAKSKGPSLSGDSHE